MTRHASADKAPTSRLNHAITRALPAALHNDSFI
jgi:hypothetical protein